MSDDHPSILHVYDTAGVACTLAKWTNKIYGVNTDVYALRRHDPFGHITYGTDWVKVASRFFPFVIKSIRNFDIVHLHTRDRVIRNIRKHHPRKPLVMHYHGTDIRGRWHGRRGFWGKADTILVSTSDLLEGALKEATYLPNPVDTDVFYPNPNPHEVDPNSALTFSHGATDLARELAEKRGLELCIHPRNKMFLEMPQFLKRFSWYIDVKVDCAGKLGYTREGSRSLTGLEALACGLKVITSDGEVKEGLPPQHRAENTVKTLCPIYMNMM